VNGTPSGRPAALAGLAEDAQAHLDVRPLVRQGEEPFARIMAAVRALGAGQVLVLRAPFEPQPLYEVMRRRGFAHWTERRADDDVTVWFYPDAATPASGRSWSRGAEPRAGTVPSRTLDVRGLEPPQPMVQVLQAIEALAPGERLEVRHDRRPVLLYPLLEERGLAHLTDEPEPGLVRIVIERPAEPA
jgi:uncharacterized protein (DUF2249 family)